LLSCCAMAPARAQQLPDSDNPNRYGHIIRIDEGEKEVSPSRSGGWIRSGERVTVRLININSAQWTYDIQLKTIDEHTAAVPSALSSVVLQAKPAAAPEVAHPFTDNLL